MKFGKVLLFSSFKKVELQSWKTHHNPFVTSQIRDDHNKSWLWWREQTKRIESHWWWCVVKLRCNCQTDLCAKRIVLLLESEDLQTHKTLGTRNQAILCVCVCVCAWTTQLDLIQSGQAKKGYVVVGNTSKPQVSNLVAINTRPWAGQTQCCCCCCCCCSISLWYCGSQLSLWFPLSGRSFSSSRSSSCQVSTLTRSLTLYSLACSIEVLLLLLVGTLWGNRANNRATLKKWERVS